MVQAVPRRRGSRLYQHAKHWRVHAPGTYSDPFHGMLRFRYLLRRLHRRDARRRNAFAGQARLDSQRRICLASLRPVGLLHPASGMAVASA